MTGTAISSARELRKIYEVHVLPIPTNRPAIRQRLPDRIFGTADQKWEAIVEEVHELHELGRPILIGTRSIDKSESFPACSRRPASNTRCSMPTTSPTRPTSWPARVCAAESPFRRTWPAAAPTSSWARAWPNLGGLHVILTEMHDSARIDRQLIGRCGRQGDPGTFRQYLSLDDDILLTGLGPDKAEKLEELGKTSSGPFDHLGRLFRKAQRIIERRHFRDRRVLMYYEKERQKLQKQMGQDPYLDTAG